MSQRQIYSLSGDLGKGLLFAPLVGLVAGAVSAIAYAYVDVYSPIVGVISALFVLGLGFAVGMAVGWGGKVGHCRNAWLLHGIGFVVGLFTLYLSWVSFEWVLLKRSGEELGLAALINLGLSPVAVWEIAVSIAETGWYSVGSMTVSGIGSWITWGLEAVAIVGLVTVAAGSLHGDAVYCERSRAWVPKRDEGIRLQIPQDEEVLQRLVEGDLEELESLERADEDELPRIKVDVWQSDGSRHTAAYQLKLEVPKMDDGELKIEEKDFSPQLVATEEEIGRIASLGA